MNDDFVRHTLVRAAGAHAGHVPTDPYLVRRAGDKRRTRARLFAAAAGLGVTGAAVTIGWAALYGPGLPGFSSGPSQALITYSRVEPEGLAGLSTDVVLELRSGCLVVGDRVTVWPRGTEWDPEAQVVTFDPGGSSREIAVGTHFPTGMGAMVRPLSQIEGHLDDQERDDVDACMDGADVSTAGVLTITYP